MGNHPPSRSPGPAPKKPTTPPPGPHPGSFVMPEPALKGLPSNQPLPGYGQSADGR